MSEFGGLRIERSIDSYWSLTPSLPGTSYQGARLKRHQYVEGGLRIERSIDSYWSLTPSLPGTSYQGARLKRRQYVEGGLRKTRKDPACTKKWQNNQPLDQSTRLKKNGVDSGPVGRQASSLWRSHTRWVSAGGMGLSEFHTELVARPGTANEEEAADSSSYL